jgi:hypothetical protein
MSYTIQDAKFELQQDFEHALNTDDMEFVADVAKRLKLAGEDEDAEVLRNIINKANNDDWAYDNFINN